MNEDSCSPIRQSDMPYVSLEAGFSKIIHEERSQAQAPGRYIWFCRPRPMLLVYLGSRSRSGQPQRATQPTYLKSSLSDAANAAKVAKVVWIANRGSGSGEKYARSWKVEDCRAKDKVEDRREVGLPKPRTTTQGVSKPRGYRTQG